MSEACIAQVQDKPWYSQADWLAKHESLLKAKDAASGATVVFLGDSITEGWSGAGQTAWEKHFAEFRPLNLGIGGDETSHVLWRIEHGALDGLQCKLVVLLIGTNNIGNAGQSGLETAEGVRRIVENIRQKLPQTKILLLGVFPRDEQPSATLRREVKILTGAIISLHDGEMIHVMDLWRIFLPQGEVLSKDLFPDFLHLSEAGYELLAQTIAPRIRTLSK